MLKHELIYKPYGDRAILIQWPEKIGEILLEEVLFCKNHLENFNTKLILEVISSYNSLLILYNTTIEDFYDAVLELKTHFLSLVSVKGLEKILWTIPVCYDSKLAPDLVDFCNQKKLSKSELIKLHSAKIYTVYFIGFLPGFLYLGGLDEKLFFPRKSQPSLNVSKGAVAIGGQQTGIYPQNSPGGWSVIGSSPMSFFNVEKKIPCMISPGDKVQFESIDISKYNDIGSLVERGVYMPKNELYEG